MSPVSSLKPPAASYADWWNSCYGKSGEKTLVLPYSQGFPPASSEIDFYRRLILQCQTTLPGIINIHIIRSVDSDRRQVDALLITLFLFQHPPERLHSGISRHVHAVLNADILQQPFSTYRNHSECKPPKGNHPAARRSDCVRILVQGVVAASTPADSLPFGIFSITEHLPFKP